MRERRSTLRQTARRLGVGVVLAALLFAAASVGLVLLQHHHRTRTQTTTTTPPTRPPARHGPQPEGIAGRWKLILNSRFNQRSLDTGLWRPGWFGTGITPAVNIHETACYNSDNVTFPGDGTMHLRLTSQPSTCSGRRQPHTAALVSTNPSDGRGSGGFEYRFGVLQARVYFPGSGDKFYDWPAVITLGQHWPKDGEDDLFESIFGFPCASVHSAQYVTAGLFSCDHALSPGWHTVASVWKPHYMAWYYDGVEVAVQTHGIPTAPMYIVLLNTASRRNPAVAHPDAMRVKYVRVWKSAEQH